MASGRNTLGFANVIDNLDKCFLFLVFLFLFDFSIYLVIDSILMQR